MVAAICTWHEHHVAAVTEIESRLERGERMAVPAPALVEAYAVLTRLPSPHRLSPADASALVEANFVEHSTVVALTGPGYGRLLRRLAKREVAGGRSYDAVIAECARRAGAEALLTFNRQHFDSSPEGVTVVDPASARPART